MSVNKSHLVPVALGDTGDEILNMAKSSANGSGSLPGAKPCINLQLLLSGSLVSDQLEIEIQMLKITNEFTSRAFDLNDFRVNFDFDPVGDIHSFR